ncbi:SGNH/GDSL hydrolase family protein [Occultella gossypii]|uniref:SGNH/GDSL hydrolase family protein n=1 Tax=Occultella gossypii TaxID=2800820 RepID=A0ABS7SBY9_9MICO|nr:SGNH/GDSL hydrolase family protein [Occultella gossypii]MBZ2197871.1 SGNH/GDSL hydrolase family protein [Occultella gossypii]
MSADQPTPGERTRRPLSIAALGSSFASGPGIDPLIDPIAMRSGRNYAHQLADRIGADLVDVTTSGATTANLLDTPQEAGPGQALRPQLDRVPADTDIVTITAGGNDLQFSAALLHTAWAHTDPQQLMDGVFPDGVPFPSDEDVERATAGLVRVVDAARSKASRARVILVDYLTVLDPVSSRSALFSEDEVRDFLVIQAALARAFTDAADRTGADLVRASTLSAAHAWDSSDPWVQPFHTDLTRTGASFHPNDAGMTAIALALTRLIAAHSDPAR